MKHVVLGGHEVLGELRMLHTSARLMEPRFCCCAWSSKYESIGPSCSVKRCCQPESQPPSPSLRKKSQP